MTAQPDIKPRDETVIQFPADADIARRELLRLQALARQYREQAGKAERAVNLLAGSHRRAEEAEATVTRVREWIAGEPMPGQSDYGEGFRAALRDIADLLGPADEEPTP